MQVFLPSEVRLEFDFRPGEDINLKGDGRFVGFVLSEDVPEHDGNALTAGMLPQDFGDQLFIFLTDGPTTGKLASTAVLPAGAYNLFILADGSPATVTLRFRELEGHIQLAPKTPAQLDLRQLQPQIPIPGNQAAYTARGYRSLETYGMGFSISWLVAPTHIASEVGACLFLRDPLADVYSRLPGRCWDGGGGSAQWVTIPPRGFATATYGNSVLSPGEWGLGGYFESVSQVNRFGCLVFWLEMS
jgi:hypothetical protein